MTPDVDEVMASVQALPPDQVAEVAYRVLRVLDDVPSQVDQAEVDAAWQRELCGRIDEIERGEADLVPHEETAELARAMLANRRA